MFCPKYKTGLIPEFPTEPEKNTEYGNTDLVIIKTCHYRHEADLAKGLLLVYDIDAVIQAEVFGPAPEKLVRLLVKKKNARKAKKILRNAEEAY